MTITLPDLAIFASGAITFWLLTRLRRRKPGGDITSKLYHIIKRK